MSIAGIGHDLVPMDRLERMLRSEIGRRFIERVLTPGEREYAQSRFGDEITGRWVEFTAGRFAAKEAVVKALGCGIGKMVGFHDLEILPDAAGRPVCSLSRRSGLRLGLRPDGYRIHLSITHTEEYASAFAVLEMV